jgi:hypothetical protein
MLEQENHECKASNERRAVIVEAKRIALEKLAELRGE